MPKKLELKAKFEQVLLYADGPQVVMLSAPAESKIIGVAVNRDRDLLPEGLFVDACCRAARVHEARRLSWCGVRESCRGCSRGGSGDRRSSNRRGTRKRRYRGGNILGASSPGEGAHGR